MENVAVVICGGWHSPSDTDQILATVAQDAVLSQLAVFHLGTASPLDGLSARSLHQELDQGCLQASPPLIIWAFSAGCVGAVALANHWHRYRNRVLAVFLVDGWGVPWGGIAPLHRLSHDSFTHTTANWLGPGMVNFVASPAVPHRQLWQQPQQVMGDQIPRSGYAHNLPGLPSYLSAADFLCGWSRHYLQSNVP